MELTYLYIYFLFSTFIIITENKITFLTLFFISSNYVKYMNIKKYIKRIYCLENKLYKLSNFLSGIFHSLHSCLNVWYLIKLGYIGYIGYILLTAMLHSGIIDIYFFHVIPRTCLAFISAINKMFCHYLVSPITTLVLTCLTNKKIPRL